MGLLNAIPIVGPVLDTASSLISAHSASEQFAHRYQTEVADLKAAGLNPALAYGQNPGQPPASINLGEPGQSLAHSAQAAAASKQAQANADLTAAQTDLLKAQRDDIINKTRADAAAAFSAAQLNDMRATTESYRPALLMSQLYQMTQENEFRNATWTQRLELIQNELKQQGLDIDYSDVRNTLQKLGLPEAKASSDYYNSPIGKYSNQKDAILDILRTIISSINPVAGAFGGNSAGSPGRIFTPPPVTFPRQGPLPVIPKLR